MKPSNIEQQILADVDADGLHIEKVVHEKRSTPGWAYSIGLHKTMQQPDIIVFGLRPATMEQLIENTVQRMREGIVYADSLEDDELLQGYTCVFKTVREIWYDVTVKHARWFYGGANFPLLQLYWPDRNGKFPWDPKCQPEVRALQPRLHVADIEASGAAWLLP
ncbi:MAG TPA: DUF4262 domain-containing protein [Thermoanaerobaculia bacterium]|nr:DUF4262 domain-containing protein [Thermoanaerobaculia bacterium]